MEDFTQDAADRLRDSLRALLKKNRRTVYWLEVMAAGAGVCGRRMVRKYMRGGTDIAASKLAALVELAANPIAAECRVRRVRVKRATEATPSLPDSPGPEPGRR